MNDVMLDLETFGTRPGCVIRSIGAIVFDPYSTQTGETFYCNVTREDQERLGLHVDPNTEAWWGRQTKDARDALAQGVGDRAQVGRGQVDRDVGDPGPPRIGLLRNPVGDLGGGPPVDVSQQAAGACGVDDPGVPPVRDHEPPPGVGVLAPLDLAAAGLIDPEHSHRRQRPRQDRVDVRDERGVCHRPGHRVVLRAGLHAGEPLRDPGAALGPQPARQPRPGRDGRQRLGE